MAYLSERLLKRIRDYAVEEPSYTCAFAAWELGISVGPVNLATKILLEKGIVKEIEPRAGPYAAVYAYDPPRNGKPVARLFPELDASRVERVAGVGSEAPKRGAPVAHVSPVGPSGRPGRDRKRSAAGFKVKRQRQGT